MKQPFACIALMLCLLLQSIGVFSQTKIVRGRVSSSDGQPLAGVNVSVKGTKKGTVSNNNGVFEISASSQDKLVISSVGFETIEKQVGAETDIAITMLNATRNLNEVVVTALGIKKEKRTLTYSTQELKSDEILKTKDPFLINALSGKVSGVQVTNASGTPGSSSRILIRGVTSFYGNNEALIVLDGIPIDNSETGTVNSGPGSNRLIDIDPATVESMNVLKGAAATALYGSAGARGVIIITTKNGGLNKKPVISFSSDLSLDQPILPAVQNKYAQGDRGVFYDGDTRKTSSSWGPLMDTLKVNGEPVKKHNQMEEFFKTGVGTNNTVSIAGGGNSSQYFSSYSYYNQQGTVTNTDFVRHSFFSKYNTRVTDKLNFTFQFNYTNSARNSMPEGYILESPIWTIFNGPISYDMKPYLNADGSQRLFRFSRNNPYWVLDNISNSSKVNRVLPLLTITYAPLKWLNVTERIGADIYAEQTKYFENLGSISNFNGVIVDRTSIFRQFNHDLIVDAHKKISNFELNLILGNNILSTYNQSTNARGVGLSIPGFANMSNASTQSYSEYHSQVRKVGFYAQANIDYKRLLSLALTGRYDGSSVLAKGNNFYPYGSAAVSFIFSELLPKSSFLNFGKLRLSYATVGNDNVGAYSLNTPYYAANVNGIAFPFQGQNGFLLSSTLGNASLKNELSKEFETGIEAKLFNNRIGVELSYFDRKVENGIIPGVSIAPSSGYTGTTVNSAQLQTKGVELLLTATPVKTAKFSWDVTLSYTKLRNKVLAIYEGIDQLANGFTQIVAGKPYGMLYGSTFKRNAEGKMLLDDGGLPIIGEPGIVGTIQPDWLAGLTNSFHYGNLGFSFFFDFRKGGYMQNNVDGYGYFYGMPKATEDRGPRVVPGIIESTNKENTIPVQGQDYFRRLNGIYEATTQEATFGKLRNVTITYDLGKGKWMTHTPFKAATLGVTGRNLWIYKPHFTGSDPEASSFGSSNGSQGMYSFSTPTNRSVVFSLRFSF